MAANGNDLELITSILSKNPLIHRPDIVFGKLSDGLDYCIFNSESQRNSFHLNLVLNTGSIHEEEFEKGFANFVQQLILTELNKELLRIRTEHLTNITSSTDFHCTIFNIYNEVENTKLNDSELRATFFDVLEIFLLTIYKFREKLSSSSDIFSDRIEEIKNKTFDIIEKSDKSVANYIEKQIFLQFHRDTLLPKRWPIGEKSSIENITVTGLLKFINKWYLPNNMCLFIVGDIPASNELLANHLSSFVSGIKSLNLEKRASGINLYETSSSHNIFSVKERIGHKTINNALNIIEKYTGSDFQREVVIQHPSIDQVSISIGVKLEICPLVDEGEIFMNAVDTIISNAIHTKLLNSLSQLACDEELTSISWDFYNSSRENCGWNTFSIVSDEKNWRAVFRLGIQQIVSICNTKMSMEEFEEIVLITISDYKKSAEEELGDDPKLVLDGLIDDWLCGSIPLSKKQEYQLFCKVVDRINPEIIQCRCKALFSHIIYYFDENDHYNKESSFTGCIFVSKPLHNSFQNSEIDPENSINTSNNICKAPESESEFIKSLLEEYKACVYKDLELSVESAKSYSNEVFFEKNSYKIERMSESFEFGIWDALKASTYITIDKIFDSIRTNFNSLVGDLVNSDESIEHLNGKYSIKELDSLAERIKFNSNNFQNDSYEQGSHSLPNDICDLGL
ncbi:insulinase-like peptidase [Cryptosporidium hominis]|uniref:Insulinase-like peptidase n=1 Tax=Cryptosporidium hominis TaxID=237895 RepID=A0ABX5BDY3_CRYHO|nr:hypothetical protein [Cryptosporidium hominis TU502]PPS95183.1 insulinase-like peptidase [Cryptosporidium hominis]|eukprot:PPS95183.1 insulinase-like peptidase [Cryptosporidium hominis]